MASINAHHTIELVQCVSLNCLQDVHKYPVLIILIHYFYTNGCQSQYCMQCELEEEKCDLYIPVDTSGANVLFDVLQSFMARSASLGGN